MAESIDSHLLELGLAKSFSGRLEDSDECEGRESKKNHD